MPSVVPSAAHIGALADQLVSEANDAHAMLAELSSTMSAIYPKLQRLYTAQREADAVCVAIAPLLSLSSSAASLAPADRKLLSEQLPALEKSAAQLASLLNQVPELALARHRSEGGEGEGGGGVEHAALTSPSFDVASGHYTTRTDDALMCDSQSVERSRSTAAVDLSAAAGMRESRPPPGVGSPSLTAPLLGSKYLLPRDVAPVVILLDRMALLLANAVTDVGHGEGAQEEDEEGGGGGAAGGAARWGKDADGSGGRGDVPTGASVGGGGREGTGVESARVSLSAAGVSAALVRMDNVAGELLARCPTISIPPLSILSSEEGVGHVSGSGLVEDAFSAARGGGGAAAAAASHGGARSTTQAAVAAAASVGIILRDHAAELQPEAYVAMGTLQALVAALTAPSNVVLYSSEFLGCVGRDAGAGGAKSSSAHSIIRPMSAALSDATSAPFATPPFSGGSGTARRSRAVSMFDPSAARLKTSAAAAASRAAASARAYRVLQGEDAVRSGAVKIRTAAVAASLLPALDGLCSTHTVSEVAHGASDCAHTSVCAVLAYFWGEVVHAVAAVERSLFAAVVGGAAEGFTAEVGSAVARLRSPDFGVRGGGSHPHTASRQTPHASESTPMAWEGSSSRLREASRVGGNVAGGGLRSSVVRVMSGSGSVAAGRGCASWTEAATETVLSASLAAVGSGAVAVTLAVCGGASWHAACLAALLPSRLVGLDALLSQGSGGGRGTGGGVVHGGREGKKSRSHGGRHRIEEGGSGPGGGSDHPSNALRAANWIPDVVGASTAAAPVVVEWSDAAAAAAEDVLPLCSVAARWMLLSDLLSGPLPAALEALRYLSNDPVCATVAVLSSLLRAHVHTLLRPSAAQIEAVDAVSGACSRLGSRKRRRSTAVGETLFSWGGGMMGLGWDGGSGKAADVHVVGIVAPVAGPILPPAECVVLPKVVTVSSEAVSAILQVSEGLTLHKSSTHRAAAVLRSGPSSPLSPTAASDSLTGAVEVLPNGPFQAHIAYIPPTLVPPRRLRAQVAARSLPRSGGTPPVIRLACSVALSCAVDIAKLVPDVIEGGSPLCGDRKGGPFFPDVLSAPPQRVTALILEPALEIACLASEALPQAAAAVCVAGSVAWVLRTLGPSPSSSSSTAPRAPLTIEAESMYLHLSAVKALSAKLGAATDQYVASWGTALGTLDDAVGLLFDSHGSAQKVKRGGRAAASLKASLKAFESAIHNTLREHSSYSTSAEVSSLLKSAAVKAIVPRYAKVHTALLASGFSKEAAKHVRVSPTALERAMSVIPFSGHAVESWY